MKARWIWATHEPRHQETVWVPPTDDPTSAVSCARLDKHWRHDADRRRTSTCSRLCPT